MGGGHGAAGVGDTVVIIAHEVGTGRGLLVEFVHRAESYMTVETRELEGVSSRQLSSDSSSDIVTPIRLHTHLHLYVDTDTFSSASTATDTSVCL